MLRSIVFCVVFCTFGSQSNGLYDLNIIHYNDFHAHFDEIAVSGASCVPSQGDCIGGFSRLYTAVMEVLEAEPDSLLLNAGETFQGTIWYNILRWNVSQHFMNMLPHDAHVLGNHEFDHGISGLHPYLAMLESPMLGANVNTTFEPSIAPFVKNHIVVERKGRKIGIIGVLLQTFSAPIGNVIMEDELETVKRETDILTAAGIDIIIVLSHIGYNSDIALAALMPPEVDIIVGGHSHSLLFNGEAPDGSIPVGEYPTVVSQDNGHKVLIVQAAAYTRYLGNIKLVFDNDGKIVSWKGEPIYLGTSIVRDPRIEELLEPWRQEVDVVAKEGLGSTLSALSNECYSSECNLGSWACDGFLEETMPLAEDGAWAYAHVCMTNAGGLRANINSGEVTTEGLLRAIPFENTVQAFDLKGEFLLEALEFSVGVEQTNPKSFYSIRMLQIAGMRAVYNASAPAGSRVVSVKVRCVRCDVPRYEPLDPNAMYRVVTQSFMGEGGDGFTMVSNNRKNVRNFRVDYNVLQDYLRRQGSMLKDLDGRIQIVY